MGTLLCVCVHNSYTKYHPVSKDDIVSCTQLKSLYLEGARCALLGGYLLIDGSCSVATAKSPLWQGGAAWVVGILSKSSSSTDCKLCPTGTLSGCRRSSWIVWCGSGHDGSVCNRWFSSKRMFLRHVSIGQNGLPFYSSFLAAFQLCSYILRVS